MWSHYIISEPVISQKLFPKMEAVKLIILKISHGGYCRYFVTQMSGPVHCIELSTNSILIKQSSLARIGLNI